MGYFVFVLRMKSAVPGLVGLFRRVTLRMTSSRDGSLRIDLRAFSSSKTRRSTVSARYWSRVIVPSS